MDAVKPGMTLSEGTEIDLIAERPVAGGRMLAKQDGQVVLVSGAIPGECVRVRVDNVTRGVAFASTTQVLEPSASRRPAFVDPLCGGTVYAHVAYEAQAELKRQVVLDALRHSARLDWTDALPIDAGREDGYRLRARLHVRRGRLGYFREGTHDLCDAGVTRQLLPETNEALKAFVQRTPRAVLDAIDAIELSENIDASERALHLTWSRDARIAPRSLADAWRVPGITGVSAMSRAPGGASSGATGGASGDIMTLEGTPAVGDAFSSLCSSALPAYASMRLVRGAASFFQANRFLVRTLADAVAEAAGDGPIVDLYAGVGLFALVLAARGRDAIIAVEGDVASGLDLDANARPFAGRVRVERTSVERYLDRASLPRTTTIVLDPPRTGLSRVALDGVLRLRARQVLYVSCDVATFARDLRRFIDTGYVLRRLRAFDLFPNSAHIESFAVLERA